MKHLTAHIWIVIFGLCSITLAKAEAPAWQIIPEKSTLTFTATQNNAPISGSFKHFTGDIHFSAQDLPKSHINIEVDINSLTMANKEARDLLKTSDWFNLKLFPQAIFSTEHFTQLPNGTYQANGNLTIRDKTLPITLVFTLEKAAPNQLVATGSTVLKRTDFSVGQGQWANTKEIKNEVSVNFRLTATQKPL